MIFPCLSKTLVPKRWLRRDFVYLFWGSKKIGVRVIENAVSHISRAGKHACSLATNPSLSVLPKQLCGETSDKGFHDCFPGSSEFSDLKGRRGKRRKSHNNTAREMNVAGLLIILHIMP